MYLVACLLTCKYLQGSELTLAMILRLLKDHVKLAQTCSLAIVLAELEGTKCLQSETVATFVILSDASAGEDLFDAD
jgi:hypothetical protein